MLRAPSRVGASEDPAVPALGDPSKPLSSLSLCSGVISPMGQEGAWGPGRLGFAGGTVSVALCFSCPGQAPLLRSCMSKPRQSRCSWQGSTGPSSDYHDTLMPLPCWHRAAVTHTTRQGSVAEARPSVDAEAVGTARRCTRPFAQASAALSC